MTRDATSVETIFLRRDRDRPGRERSAYLAPACGDDDDLRRQRRAACSRPTMRPGASSTRRPRRPPSSVGSASVERRPGTVIGPYKLLQPIGEGGMGTVYMAEQTQPVRRTGRAEAHQGRHGQPPGPRPVRGRAPGPGPDGPPQHRQGPRRRHHRHGPPLLRHGAGQGHPDHPVLRRTPADASRAARAGHPGLPGRAARPPEGDHPPRPQALQRPDRALRRQAGPQGHRLRRGQGDRPAADRSDAVHRVRGGRRHARVHEPRAGGAEPARHRHPQRHLQPGRAALRALDRHDAAGAQAAEGRRRSWKCCG